MDRVAALQVGYNHRLSGPVPAHDRASERGSPSDRAVPQRREISVRRSGAGGTSMAVRFEVPTAEPDTFRVHREKGGKAPGSSAAGAVYARGGANGPTDEELTKASVAWLKAKRPGALDSKVEAEFRGRAELWVNRPLAYPFSLLLLSGTAQSFGLSSSFGTRRSRGRRACGFPAETWRRRACTCSRASTVGRSRAALGAR